MVGNSSTLVARTYNYVKARASNLAVDNQLQADFATGPLLHKVLLGLDHFDLKAGTDYRSAFIAPIDAYNPAYGSPIPSLTHLLRSSNVTTSKARPVSTWRIKSSWIAGHCC